MAAVGLFALLGTVALPTLSTPAAWADACSQDVAETCEPEPLEPCTPETPAACPVYIVYRDADGDGYGNPWISSYVAFDQPGFVRSSQDCDDSRASTHPGAQEVGSSEYRDEDCDGLVDDLDPSVLESSRSSYYADQDGDGYGAGIALRRVHPAPPYTALSAGDCQDLNAAFHPAATDLRGDGADQDCSGADAAAAPSTVTYAGSSVDPSTRRGQVVSFRAAVASAADCLAGRLVTVTANGQTTTAITDSTGVASVAYDVSRWRVRAPYQIKIAPLASSTSTGGACAAESSGALGSWTKLKK